MKLLVASTYWVIVVLWSTILIMFAILYLRNRRMYGTTQLLLAVLALDTTRNIIENLYFGLYFGANLGFLPASIGIGLGRPIYLILPKLANIVAGCVVLGVLLLRWLPAAVRERAVAEAHAKELHALATTDGLTGLINRRHFTALAETERERQERYNRPLSLLMLDIDHFKSVNDRYGHAIGDQVLCRVAEICVSQVRKTDILARMGGEEFAIMLTETDRHGATQFAERLCASIARQPLSVGPSEIACTVSIGVAEMTDAHSLSETLSEADAALYEAKRSGRNRACLFDRRAGKMPAMAGGLPVDEI